MLNRLGKGHENGLSVGFMGLPVSVGVSLYVCCVGGASLTEDMRLLWPLAIRWGRGSSH